MTKTKSNKEKIKTFAKYTTNILGMIMMLITGIEAVEGITIPYYVQIIGVMSVIQGVIGAYLTKGKLWGAKEWDYQ